MGCMMSQDNATNRSKKIDKMLRQTAANDLRTIKLLLLGAGESGKSTILKQMRIIHEDGYNHIDKINFKPVVYNNIISSLNTIIASMPQLNIEFANKEREKDAMDLLQFSFDINETELPESIIALLKRICEDDAIHEVMHRLVFDPKTRESHINDSAPYFLSQLNRICAPDYLPTETDILRTRIKTTGIIETQFHFRDRTFLVFDVGGQRSERKKWIHCFEHVTALIFCVALSEYDMQLLEDPNTNRMRESLKLFDSICNNKWFVDTSIILFLNKKDLFEEKIQRIPLNYAFPEYSGKMTAEEAGAYIQAKFENVNKRKSGKKEIYTHFTCATDTHNIRFVFEAVTEIIISDNLRSCGLY